jgi:HSP20 family protein
MEGHIMLAKKAFGFPSLDFYHPFREMDQMAKQMYLLTNAVFGQSPMRMFPARVFPAVNITEDKEKYYVRAELPGMKAEDISLEVTGNKLSLSGERKIQSEGENAKYHRREREAGRFSRVIELPGDVNAESVNAKLVNGFLTITIAKSEAAKPRQIRIG